MQKLAVKEQIVKTVVKSGNGGAVWVPKNWLGQEVVVILPDKPKLNVKEKIIHLLEPFLKDAIAVFLYGSYARKEETKESDVDVMVITKDRNKKINIKEQNLEITTFDLESLKIAIQKYPVLYYQMIQEAEPLINSKILEELKNIKIDHGNFKRYIQETREHTKSNKELLELDRLDGEYVKSYSAIYSIILRLRGLFIIRCILIHQNFSNNLFEKWIINKGVSNKEFEEVYKAYRAIRDNKIIKNIQIKIYVAEKLLNILTNELNSLELKVYGKQKKEA